MTIIACFAFYQPISANIPDDNQILLDLDKLEAFDDAQWDALTEGLEDNEDGLAVLEEDIDDEEEVYVNIMKTS